MDYVGGFVLCLRVRRGVRDDLRIETWSDFKCFNVKFYICALVGVLIK